MTWIDPWDLAGYRDDLVDISAEATNVPVSWSKFSHVTPSRNHAKTMLINGEAAGRRSAVIHA